MEEKIDRFSFSFSGNKLVEQDLSLDPGEFGGMTVTKITKAIKQTLKELAPGVDFFTDEIELAAEAIANPVEFGADEG